MPLDRSKSKELSSLARTILEHLERVANAAKVRLDTRRPRSDASALIGGANTMAGSPASRNLTTVVASDRAEVERLSREPFVARVVLRFEDDPSRGGQSVLYVTRASAPSWISIENARFATYTAPLGRVAELPVGSHLKLPFGGEVRHVVIVGRTRLNPSVSSKGWDALKDRFEFEGWRINLESLLRYLDELERSGRVTEEAIPDLLGPLLRRGAEAAIFREKLKRHAIERIALRDQPILDEHQGEVFRLPLNQRLVLLGPPGSGKTTTLIRRLAQKRKPETLTDDETLTLNSAGVEDLSLSATSWVMFTPTELLKLYLRDAFNEENVPAGPENLRTWSRERVRFGRTVLAILRSGESPGFQLDDSLELLIDNSNDGLLSLYSEFSEFFHRAISQRLADSYTRLTEAEALPEILPKVISAVGRLRDGGFTVLNAARLLDGSPEIQEGVRKLSTEIDGQTQRLGNRLLQDYPALLSELSDRVKEFIREETDDEEEDLEERDSPLAAPAASEVQVRPELAAQLLLNAIGRLASGRASGRATGGRAGKIIDFLGQRVPPDEDLLQLGSRIVTRTDLRAIIRSPRLFVLGVQGEYSRFRRERLRQGQLFRAEAIEAARQRKISNDELDVLILTALRNARTLLRENGWRLRTPNDWMERIVSEHRLQVFVDEVTDFSAIQLACTVELTNPRLRSWFACGDLNQRITSYGIDRVSYFERLKDANESPFEVRTLRVGYRQSPALRELAAALCADPNTAAIANSEIDHESVAALLAENCSGTSLACWLTDRIIEIERALGSLPSIAVFVDGKAEMDEIIDLAAPLLAEKNVKIVGYPDGRAVGDEQEVRVFDVQHIKGLEFEAVFFIGVDKLATRLRLLFDRYFYVGVSRAATYLGITCEASLPERLHPIRGHFQGGNWA
jgi:hypothetical protein